MARLWRPRHLGCMRILVIEDDAQFARLLTAMLAQDTEPHAVVHAASLAAALARLAEQRFDVLLVDLGLPDSKGLPTFHTARDHAGDAPVVVVSGTRDDALALEAIREGAADYLVKGGLTAQGVQRVVHHAVERKRLILDRERLVGELQAALAEVKTLHGIIPICSSCKRIRDDAGAWQQVEEYVRERSDAEFSHGVCPACARKLYGNLAATP